MKNTNNTLKGIMVSDYAGKGIMVSDYAGKGIMV